MKAIRFIGIVIVLGTSVATAGQVDSTPTKATPPLAARLNAAVAADKVASPAVRRFIGQVLLPHCRNPLLVKAVGRQNAQNVPLSEIRRIDRAWRTATEFTPTQKRLTTNPVAVELKRIAKAHPAIVECLVMDNQGALVGVNAVTTDYWQADERKWIDAFAKGRGGVSIAMITLDPSSRAMTQMVSLPVVDAEGKVIGAIAFGLAVIRIPAIGAADTALEAKPAAQADPGVLLARLTREVAAARNATPTVRRFTRNTLVPLCRNPVFLKAVAEQNARRVAMGEISRIDAAWVGAESRLPIQTQLLSNPVATELRRLAATYPAIMESFVMDNQGALVGTNEVISDYWQGDEPKWKRSFRDGRGGLHVGRLKLDRSSRTVDQKVSLPIIDNQGRVIGAVTFDVSVTKLARQ